MDKNLIIEKIELAKTNYLIYRGSSFDAEGNLLFAKDDAQSYAEGMDYALKIILEIIDRNQCEKSATEETNMTFNAIYTLETGASKKRKKAEEVEYWNSLNGPVTIITKDKDEDQ